MELFSPEWFTALVAIVLVDLLLAGDNAIVIALAARDLPAVWRKRAIIYGTAGAIFVRVVLVFFVSQLLKIPGLSIVGGGILYIIAWRLLSHSSEVDESKSPANSFWAAMGAIIVADTVMGLDNILAISAAARGEVWLIVIGLGLSIPIMMSGSVLILKLFEKLPWLIIAGCGLLAAIAGRIILADEWLSDYLDWSAVMVWGAVLVVAAAVTLGATWHGAVKKRRAK